MKLKTILFTAVMFAVASFTIMANNEDPVDSKVETATVNVEKSTIEWKAYKVTGKHNGQVQLKEANLKVKDGKLIGGEFTADMTSIEVLDLSGNMKSKLEGHLKSPDFFDISTHPTATFVTSKVKSSGEGEYEVTGELTIKDITHPITFTAMMVEKGGERTTSAVLKVDRSKYNVRYGSETFFGDLGDNAIYDEFDLNIILVSDL